MVSAWAAEGQREAQNAMARLDRAQSTEAYIEALTELRGILERAASRPQGWAFDQAETGGPIADRSAFLNNSEAKEFAAKNDMTVEQLWENMSPEDRALFQ